MAISSCGKYWRRLAMMGSLHSPITTLTTTRILGVPTQSVNISSITTKADDMGMSENRVKLDKEYLKRAGLRADRIPRHVGLTLDGNRRWSEKNNNGKLTYVPFYSRYIEFGDLCVKLGIPFASWFIFSTCTWKRTQEANNLMFKQLQESLEANLHNFLRQGIRVSIIGDKWKLPRWCEEGLKKVEEATQNGKTLHMMYAVSYGGREDILEATKTIAKKTMAGEIELENMDESMVENELWTSICGAPVPDLMIRNGAKHRISNFFLWQASHAQLYFSNSLSVDFDEAEFLQALRWFQNSNSSATGVPFSVH